MIACRFSGFSKVYTFGARRTSAKIIEMIKDWSLTYSYPETFQSDGPQVFVGEEMQNWLKKTKSATGLVALICLEATVLSNRI